MQPDMPTNHQNQQTPSHYDAPSRPGRVISIIGLVLPFIGLAIAGLVLSIIGLVQSKKAGKADVIAIIGLIVNILAVLLTTLILGLLVFVGYQNVQAQARDTKRQADAQIIVTLAQQLHDQTNIYPRTDKAGYIEDLSTAEPPLSVQKEVSDRISSDRPSPSNLDVYKIEYCGADDAASATGISVIYYNEADNMLDVRSAGTGCIAGSGETGITD